MIRFLFAREAKNQGKCFGRVFFVSSPADKGNKKRERIDSGLTIFQRKRRGAMLRLFL